MWELGLYDTIVTKDNIRCMVYDKIFDERQHKYLYAETRVIDKGSKLYGQLICIAPYHLTDYVKHNGLIKHKSLLGKTGKQDIVKELLAKLEG